MWPNPRETADLVTITEDVFNEKLHFLCSVYKTQRRLPPLAHIYAFGLPPSPTYDAYVTFFANQPLHNHLTHNACNTFL